MIYTGYFDKLDEYIKRGLIPVCIAGYPTVENFTGVRYRELAPRKIWWNEWHDKHLSNDWYEAKYKETVLNKLSPEKVKEDMESYGESVVLLCLEKPNEFCHRHIVSKWLNEHNIPAQEYPL